MRRESSTKAVVESGLLTAITIIFILLGNFVPIFYFICLFLWPLPVALIKIKYGTKYSIISLVAVGAISVMITDPMTALNSTVSLGLLGIILGYCIKNNKAPLKTVFYLAIGTFISLVFSFLVYSLFLNQNMIQQMIDTLNSSLKMTKDLYSKAGVSKQQIDMMSKMMPNANFIKTIMPFMLIFTSMLNGYISYWFAILVFNKFGYNLEKVKPVSEWYIPNYFFMGLFVIFIGAYLLNYFKIKYGVQILQNVNYLLMITLAIDGLAFISSFLKNRDVSKTLRIVIIVFIMFTPFVNILIFLGIFDFAVNYRGVDPTRPSLFKK